MKYISLKENLLVERIKEESLGRKQNNSAIVLRQQKITALSYTVNNLSDLYSMVVLTGNSFDVCLLFHVQKLSFMRECVCPL